MNIEGGTVVLEIMTSEAENETANLLVIGVGGAGNNAVNRMIDEGIKGVEFVCINTDKQVLKRCKAPICMQIGEKLTKGLGAGAKPEIGEKAAEESRDELAEIVKDADMVFVTCGMGGGTGTGAAPIIAKTAKDMEILTVGIVTIPFLFEGNKKIDQALDGVEEMSKHVDALLVINNERLRDVYSDISVMNAFGKADDTLSIAAKSIAEIITLRGIINLDFNDVKTVLKDGGVAIMSTGYGEGEGRVTQAITDALHSPLLNNNDIFNSKKVLFVITYSPNSELMMGEMDEIHEFMSKFGKDVETKWGLYTDETLENKVKFTILATGFGIKDVPGMDNVLKQRSLEEQKRLDDLEEEEQKKDERRSDYYGKSILKSSIRKKRPNIYIFSQEDLANDDIISMVETTPTYKRTKMELENIRSKATTEEKIAPEPETTTNTGSMTITF